MPIFKRKENNFEKVKNDINILIDKGKYDSAISKFSDLSNFYNKLVLTKKIEHKEGYDLIRDQLILYMKVLEIDFLISNNETEKIKETLIFIENNLVRLKMANPLLLNYIKGRYEHYLRVYYVMKHKEEFDDNLNNLYRLVELKEYSKALELFPSILKSFDDIGYNMSLDPSLYSKLVSLKEEIEMKALKNRAYSKPAKVDTKLLKAKLRRAI